MVLKGGYIMASHGNIYRSGDAPPSSKFFDQGKFGRLFPSFPPFSLDTPSLRSALKKLGEKDGIIDAKDDLTAHPRDLILNPALFANNPDNPDMTAGMTFLGQFLDHDMKQEPDWTPTLSINGEFTMVDLLKFAGVVTAF
jgi:hypothetical protein